MADGFLGRWARRKNDAREGRPLDEPAVQIKPTVPLSSAVPGAKPGSLPAAGALSASPDTPPTTTPEGAPEAEQKAPVELPTIEQARALTTESDFKPFIARGVSPEVRNTAMKKLFTDPHYNVMDRLDIYIDDYSNPEPLPESMLRQMASAKFLGMFDEEEKKADTPAGDDADAPGAQSVAQSYATPDIAPDDVPTEISSQPAAPDAAASQVDHAHTDLRLQPDDAAPAEDSRRGT